MNKDLTWNASDNKDRESTERTSRENGPVTVELLEALRDGKLCPGRNQIIDYY